MFDNDDGLPAKPAPRNLEPLARIELTDYISELKQEITRVEAELVKKEAHANVASSFFRTSDGTP